MKSEFLEVPQCMSMGFHYTRQYSRRTRIKVLGLVDHSTEEWVKWYLNMHEEDAVNKIAEAGYTLIEIHFLYGYGLKGEQEEYELTKKMVENAHRAGIKVLGYFQFFSVQEELFFLENPWAEQCVQLKADGTRRLYNYDRPALCFSHEKVKQYYLDGVELGLTYCNLDGIRLDNDYFLGCYCDKCQEEFRKYLKNTFSEEKALRVLGLRTVEGMSLVPVENCKDPLWQETVKFRQIQRQQMMKLISEKIISIKPDGILGGNPAICRRQSTASHNNLYYPDLGETHHLICAENSLFPARTENSIRHQVQIYKHGQANHFKVFPSHHLYNQDKSTRWPETTEECALSLYEAVCFGGHMAATTWGLRLDANEKDTLYERPYFLKALKSVKTFLNKHQDIYRGVSCSASIGIYINRESLNCDYQEAWYSLQGLLQILLTNQIPFKFVDRDGADALTGIDFLIVPNVRPVSENQLDVFKGFLNSSKILLTGESCLYDEYFLRRNWDDYRNFLGNPNVIHLENTPEKASDDEVEFHYNNYLNVEVPKNSAQILEVLRTHCCIPVKVSGSRFIGVDTFSNEEGDEFIHLLNYDNTSPVDLDICINQVGTVEILCPEDEQDCESEPTVEYGKDSISVKIIKLHTYAVIKISG